MATNENPVKRLHKGQIKEIADNYKITYHAKQRIKERTKINPDDENGIYWKIRHSKFAFIDNDKSYIVEIDDKTSFVFVYNHRLRQYIFITCLGVSRHDYSVEEKYEVAKKYRRKKERR